MDVFKTIILILGFLLAMIGVIMIFDARKLTKERFSFGDQNEGSKWMKVIGFILSIVGAIIVMINVL